MDKAIDYNIRQRGTNYLFVDWKDENGKRQRRALGTTDMKEARKKAKEIIYGAKAVTPKSYGIIPHIKRSPRASGAFRRVVADDDVFLLDLAA